MGIKVDGKARFESVLADVNSLGMQILEVERQSREELSSLTVLITIQADDLTRRTEEVEVLRVQLADCMAKLKSAKAEVQEVLPELAKIKRETTAIQHEADSARSKSTQLSQFVSDLVGERNRLSEEIVTLHLQMKV